MDEHLLELASEREELQRAKALEQHRNFKLEPGIAGECEYCGKHSPRLVKNACAPCRDEWKLG